MLSPVQPTVQLTTDPSPHDVLDRFAELTRRVLDVPAALVTVIDGDCQVFPGAAGLADPWLSLRRTPLAYSLCRYVVRDGTPLVIADAARSAHRDNPGLTALGIGAYAGFPLVDANGSVLGALAALDSHRRGWTERHLADLADLAQACALDLELRRATEQAHGEALAHRRLLESMPVGYIAYDGNWRVIDVNTETALVGGRDRADLIGRTLWELFPGVEGSDYELALQRVHATGRGEEFEFFYRPARRWFDVRVSSAPPGVATFSLDVTERHQGEATAQEMLRRMPVGFVAMDREFVVVAANALGAELAGSTVDRLVGHLVWDLYPALADSEFGPAFRRVAATGEAETVEAYYPAPLNAWFDARVVADRDRINVYFSDVSERHRMESALRDAADRERSVAVTLQQAMLTELPAVPGMELTARYLTAEGTVQVGGDWYDAVLQPDRSLTVTIGDVCGHGIGAATAMGQLRAMLRGFGWDDDTGAAAALTRLDRAATGLGGMPLTTLMTARLSPTATGGAAMVWSNAGHVPPLVVLPGGQVQPVEAVPDLMLGVQPGFERSQHTMDLSPGATLFLYTDGLVERPQQCVRQGIARLADVLTRHHALDLEHLVERTLGDMGTEHLGDDVAVLAVRLDSSRGDETTRSRVVARSERGPGEARAFVGEVADGLSQPVLRRATLLTSEAVTNAVRHGAGEIVVDVARTAGALQIAVHDGGPVVPVLAAPPAQLAAGGRGLAIIDALSDRWGVRPHDRGPGKAVWFRIEY